jgi:hypothetical protein
VNPKPRKIPGGARTGSSTFANDLDLGKTPAIMGRVTSASGLGRVIIVVFGALVVLQSSQDVGPLKIAYLAAASVVMLGTFRNVWRMRHSSVVASARPWLITSGVVTALVILSLPVAATQGTSISAWLRDAAAYGLLMVAPWLAVDLALSASRRAVLALTVAAGAATTLSYAIAWLEKRHIWDFPLDRLALPSITLAASLFAVSLAIAFSSRRRRYLWVAVASTTIGLLVVSGSRQSLALLIVCPTALIASWFADRTSPLRPKLLVAVMPVIVAIAIVAATVVRLPDGAIPATGPGGTTGGLEASPTPAPTGRNLTERYDSIGSVLAGRDPSFQERLSQTRAVWSQFLTSPIVGGGLGMLIPWTDSSGVTHTDNAFTADTPILVFAKFGLFGLALIAALVWAAVATIRALRVAGRATRRSWLATIAFAATIVVLMPFGWQVEDKGTALAMILVIAFGLVELRDARPSASTSPAIVPTRS